MKEASLINEVQYRLELGKLGMRHVYHEHQPTADNRIEAIKAYREAWMTAPFSFNPAFPSGPTPYRFWPYQAGLLPYIVDNTLHLWRPPSRHRDIEEKTWSFGCANLNVQFTVCAADLEQDLLALSTRPFLGE